MLLKMTTLRYSLVVVTTASGQHTRKTPDFCEAYSQQLKTARTLLEIIKPV